MAARGQWPVIGIDLGTTYSCVAVWKRDYVEIITNDQGNRTTPSWVAFTDEERFIGDAAVLQATRNPLNTVFDSKRLIGRRFYDDSVQEDIKLWPFKIVDGTNYNKEGQPLISVTHMGKTKNFTPQEISAMILTKMKVVAENYLGEEVRNAIVTVPAYFNDSQRRATQDAGTIAGLNLVCIINEPTAAAIAYGANTSAANKKEPCKNVLIFDLGGGTFDVSLVATEKGEIKVKVVGGDTHLGGGDFDNKLTTYLIEEFEKKHDKDVSGDPKVLAKLRKASEKAKRFLSCATQAIIEIDCLYEGIDFTCTVTRARFESLNMEMFKKCIEEVKQCLNEAKMEKCDVDHVVLVGGSTRIPKVQQLLQEFFDEKELCRTINPDEAVAYGAAIHAAVLSGVGGIYRKFVLFDVTPLTLGVKNVDGKLNVIIPRNTRIPVKNTITVGTALDNQTTACFQVFEGEELMVRDNHFLDEFEVSGFPPTPSRETKFEVCFEIDVNGILNVSAVELSTGLRNQITITNRCGRLTVEDLKKMTDEAEIHNAQDEQRRKSVENMNAMEGLN